MYTIVMWLQCAERLHSAYVFPSSMTFVVKFELGWTGVLSVFSFGECPDLGDREIVNLLSQPLVLSLLLTAPT